MIKIKKFIFLLVLCAVVVSGNFFPPPVAAAHDELPVAIIVAYKGEVYLYRDGSEKKILIRGPEGIYFKDTIVTNPESGVKILAKDDSVITLGADSALKVNAYDINDGVTQRVVLLRLTGGSLRAIVHRAFKPESSVFKVETGTAVVMSKGTDFIMSSVGDNLEVAAIQGKVDVVGVGLNEGPEVKVAAGYITTVDHKGKITKPGKLGQAKLDSLLAMTELPVTMAFELALKGCQACHLDMFKVVDDFAFKHSETKQCSMCHIKGALNAGERDKSLQVNYPSRDNILFIGTNAYSEYAATVTVMDDTGLEAVSEEIEFVVREMKEVPGEEREPVITGLKVSEVQRGVFLVTVLTWKTDEPALSMVEYGMKEGYEFSVRASNHYVTDHKVSIDRFKTGKKYNLRAVSEDIFGNVAVSEPIKVKIDKPFMAEQDEGEMPDEIVFGGFDVMKVGGKIALRWSSDIRTMASIHLVEKIEEEADDKVVLKDKHAPGLRNEIETGLVSCQECHSGDEHMSASHPFGEVDWSKGAIKAKELPLGDGSQMMCSTCHESHGSNHGFMLRKSEEDLCSACHQERKKF
ncbi:hypothetical protein MNBD_DELTA01-1301 [hydrothermal vent metagenome]|uniref:Doubled CXXCH motif domain-containing protein n=1 Tax=hydrothermal vent metagenome TaxID=652676 RepID=A0A3B0RP75_9ZZZZ